MAFKSTWTPPPRLRDLPPPEVAPRLSGGFTYEARQTLVSVPKEQIVRSEPYRRLVAALPCAHCLIEGFSQAAHPPPTAKGRKEDDRATFPLCATRPGVRGCHADFDQYRLIPAPAMREQARTWGRQTRAAIRNGGNWPASVPEWREA
jgi:hypothetical protein